MSLYGRYLKTKMYYLYKYNLYDPDLTINYNFVLSYEIIKIVSDEKLILFIFSGFRH